jgi:Virus-capping methyltransferase
VLIGSLQNMMEGLASHEALHVYLEDKECKAELRRKSGHLSSSYPSQKRDSTRMLLDYFASILRKDSNQENRMNLTTRKLVLFSDFRSPRHQSSPWSEGKHLTSRRCSPHASLTENVCIVLQFQAPNFS